MHTFQEGTSSLVPKFLKSIKSIKNNKNTVKNAGIGIVATEKRRRRRKATMKKRDVYVKNLPLMKRTSELLVLIKMVRRMLISEDGTSDKERIDLRVIYSSPMTGH